MSRHQFRKKPVVIEAFRCVRNRGEQTMLLPPPWLMDAIREKRFGVNVDGTFFVDTLEGRVLDGKEGDWVIRGVEGEIYPCDATIFAKTYESVDALDMDLK